MKNMANRIAALEGRGTETSGTIPFPIYIIVAGGADDQVTGLHGHGLTVTREAGETLEALKARARALLGEAPSQPAILAYTYAEDGSLAQ